MIRAISVLAAIIAVLLVATPPAHCGSISSRLQLQRDDASTHDIYPHETGHIYAKDDGLYRSSRGDRKGRRGLAICTAAEAFAIGSLYHELRTDGSSCPGQDLLSDLRDAYFEYSNYSHASCARRPVTVTDVVFVDVGFNKGYNFASWMAVFHPELNIMPRAWYRAIKQTNITVDVICGACMDCWTNQTYDSMSVESKGHRFRSTLLGIDLNAQNIDLVKRIISKLDVKRSEFADKIYLNITHMGASDSNGFVHSTLQCTSGQEVCSMAKSLTPAANKFASNAIPLTTIDSLFESYVSSGQLRARTLWPGSDYRPYVDILLIDTEGHDAIVLSRAHKVLSQRMARLVVFEYNGLCPWPNTPLLKVINMFHSHQYVCYFPSWHKRTWRITGCYTDLFEFHKWSNVYCVYRRDPWFRLLESRRVRPRAALDMLRQMGKEDRIVNRDFPRPKCE